jgi:DNA helicase II / ATP-dependent DNA helicase PcrA
MAKVVKRKIGGAGTGKTSQLLADLTQAREELRLSPEEVGLCTFTRAGRAELSTRAAAAWSTDVDRLTKTGWFRTAHSIAYKQLECSEGQMLQGKEGCEWLAKALGCSLKVRYDARSNEQVFVDDGGGNGTAGTSLRAWELARSSHRPVADILAQWRLVGDVVPDLSVAREYIERYERAKRKDGRYDFTDLVAKFAGVKFVDGQPVDCEPEGEVPESLRALAIDEAQDSSALVDRVCKRLANSPRMERVFLFGDPFQSVYSFGGSDFRHFMSWEAEEETMPRSYRCPPKVMELGENCLRRMKSGYFDRRIRPAEHEGKVSRCLDAASAIESIPSDGSVLILGRCNFSLNDYESILKMKGLPYSHVDRVGSTKQLSGYSAWYALEQGRPTLGEDVANAIDMTVANHKEHGPLLRRGAKSEWADGRMSDLDIILPKSEDYRLIGCTETLEQLIRSGQWVECLDAKYAERARQWRKAAVTYGEDAATNPRIRLSTIHSAKGLEADTVILSTISSPAVDRSRNCLVEAHDEECRVAYVAVTRTRRRLMLVDDGGYHRLRIDA